MMPDESNIHQPGAEAESNFQKALEDAATGSNESGVGSIADALEAGAADISRDSKGNKESDTPPGEKAETTSGV